MEHAMRRNRRQTSDRAALSFDRPNQTMTVGRRSVVMASGPEDNETILRAYLKLVSEQRGVPVGQSVLLRRRDVAVLADFLDLDDEALDRKLAAVLRLTRQEAAELRGQLLRHRVAVAAVGVGMLAAVPFAGDGAVAADAAPTHGTGTVVEASTRRDPGAVEVDVALDGGALARMDAVVAKTPPVVVPRHEWPRGASTAAPAMVPAPTVDDAVAIDDPVEIGDAARWERDPFFVPPPGVEIGDAFVIER
jgi:hypothetical protein